VRSRNEHGCDDHELPTGAWAVFDCRFDGVLTQVDLTRNAVQPPLTRIR